VEKDVKVVENGDKKMHGHYFYKTLLVAHGAITHQIDKNTNKTTTLLLRISIYDYII
jgi:phage-related protein